MADKLSVSQNRLEVSCWRPYTACNSQRLHEENQLWFSNSKYFLFIWTKKHFTSEWYQFHYKPWDWESCREKGWKITRIVSLDQLGSRRAMQLLIFLSCLSPRRVKKLQKFINSCLKVGHSANFKHSKSTYNWRLNLSSWEMFKIITSEALDTMHAQLFLIAVDSCRFDIGRFRAEPTNYKFVYTRVMHLHIAVPTITCTLR